jgi:exonuclease SbcC
VLPQGAFARFLRDEQSKRQDLLVKLLDLEMYTRMAKAANQLRAARAEAAERVQMRIDGELAEATPAARRAAQARITGLEALAVFVEEATPRLAVLESTRTACTVAADEAGRRARELRAVAAPPGDLDLAEKVRELATAHEAARVELAAASVAREKAEAARADPAQERQLREALAAHGRRAELAAEVEKRGAELAAKQKTEKAGAKKLAAAVAALEAAESALREAQREHLAAHLAAGLEAGDECPVCGALVAELPVRDADEGSAAAEAALERAREVEKVSRAEHRSAEQAAAVCSDRLQERRGELAELDHRLEGAAAAAEAEKQLAAIAETEAGYTAALKREQSAASEVSGCAERAAALAQRRASASKRLQAARDPFAALGAPTLVEGDLAAAWRELVEWAGAEAPRQEHAAAEAAAEAGEARAAQEALRLELTEAFAGVELEVGTRSPLAVCHEALAEERQRLAAIGRALEEAKKARAEAKGLREEAAVAKELGRHLGARHFEAWFLQRALGGLVSVATRLLLELSRGQYSLSFDNRRNEFGVVDHANADEPRLARTLSGGETFLASLALALALSEQVTRLAARGGARLDAIFLDEGFGTLDADTLDTVAAAIEELGARGHVVGLVTHVPELAERVPVRFEVTKDPRGSRVVRVDG